MSWKGRFVSQIFRLKNLSGDCFDILPKVYGSATFISKNPSLKTFNYIELSKGGTGIQLL